MLLNTSLPIFSAVTPSGIFTVPAIAATRLDARRATSLLCTRTPLKLADLAVPARGFVWGIEWNERSASSSVGRTARPRGETGRPGRHRRKRRYPSARGDVFVAGASDARLRAGVA